jgi:hypothetical protein
MCPSRGDSKGVSGKTPLALEVQEGGKRLLSASTIDHPPLSGFRIELSLKRERQPRTDDHFR